MSAPAFARHSSRIGRTYRRPKGKVEYTVLAKYCFVVKGRMVTEYTCDTQNGLRHVSGSQFKHMLDITLKPEWH